MGETCHTTETRWVCSIFHLLPLTRASSLLPVAASWSVCSWGFPARASFRGCRTSPCCCLHRWGRARSRAFRLTMIAGHGARTRDPLGKRRPLCTDGASEGASRGPPSSSRGQALCLRRRSALCAPPHRWPPRLSERSALTVRAIRLGIFSFSLPARLQGKARGRW